MNLDENSMLREHIRGTLVLEGVVRGSSLGGVVLKGKTEERVGIRQVEQGGVWSARLLKRMAQSGPRPGEKY